MQTIWIVAAANSRVKIFETQDTHNLREIEDIENYSSSAHNSEPYFQKPGKDINKSERAGGQSAISATDYEKELFSKDVGDLLNKACSEHRYDKLRLLAAPEFLEKIRSSLSKEAQQCIEEEQAKDISWFDTKAIKDYIRNDLH